MSAPAPTEKVILVTGASTGIGRAVVASALAGGAGRVYASVRKQADADSLSAEFGARVSPLVFDVVDDVGVSAAAERVAGELGGAKLFGLVNNAGIGTGGPLLHIAEEEFKRVVEVNVFGVHRVTQAFVPLLGADKSRTGKPGRIVMMSSVGGLRALPFNGIYNASKFALEGYAQALRMELMMFGIDVIVIGPGAIQTPIWDKAEAAGLDRFSNTPYGPFMANVSALIQQYAREGLPASAVGDLVWRALTVRNPKPRYSIMRNKLQSEIIPTLLPRRMIDRITARVLGLPKRP